MTGIKRLEVDDEGLRISASRAHDGAEETFDVPLPAVVSVKEGINLPRYPSLPGRLRAKRAPIKTVELPAQPPDGLRKLSLRVPAGAGGGPRCSGPGCRPCPRSSSCWTTWGSCDDRPGFVETGAGGITDQSRRALAVAAGLAGTDPARGGGVGGGAWLGRGTRSGPGLAASGNPRRCSAPITGRPAACPRSRVAAVCRSPALGLSGYAPLGRAVALRSARGEQRRVAPSSRPGPTAAARSSRSSAP